ncbi:MAG: hypothetical protein MK538_17345 [Planctomycetes bacterium]|nr:hypothetical protein [Planctomycetota bacterium]
MGENDYQARLGTVVTGFATSIDNQGTAWDQVLMSTHGGFLTLLVLDAAGNGRELIDHFPGGPFTAGAFSNTRPDCSDPIVITPIPWIPPVVEPLPWEPPIFEIV